MEVVYRNLVSTYPDGQIIFTREAAQNKSGGPRIYQDQLALQLSPGQLIWSAPTYFLAVNFPAADIIAVQPDTVLIASLADAEIDQTVGLMKSWAGPSPESLAAGTMKPMTTSATGSTSNSPASRVINEAALRYQLLQLPGIQDVVFVTSAGSFSVYLYAISPVVPPSLLALANSTLAGTVAFPIQAPAMSPDLVDNRDHHAKSSFCSVT